MINPVDDSSSHNYYTQQTTDERKDIMLKNLWEIEKAFEEPKYVNLESSDSSAHGTQEKKKLISPGQVPRYANPPKKCASRVQPHRSVQEEDSPSNWMVLGKASEGPKGSTARQTLVTHNSLCGSYHTVETAKLSAEELIRNYTNANFMPQKQPNDRLELLCQTKELNPLVSLTVDKPCSSASGRSAKASTVVKSDSQQSARRGVPPSSKSKSRNQGVGSGAQTHQTASIKRLLDHN